MSSMKSVLLYLLLFVGIYPAHQTAAEAVRGEDEDSRVYNVYGTTTTGGTTAVAMGGRSMVDTLASILRSPSRNSTGVAEKLLEYARLLNENSSLLSTNPLSAYEIDQLVVGLNGTDFHSTTNTSFVMTLNPIMYGVYGSIVVGGIFYRKAAGQLIDTNTNTMFLSSNMSAAAVFETTVLSSVTSLNMLIIDKAPFYENLDQSDGQRLVSSVVVVGLQTVAPSTSPVNVSLYLQVLDEYRSLPNGSYYCAWYNLQSTKWSKSNCSRAIFNSTFNRYECQCNHLSTFGLIWSPSACGDPNQTVAINGTCIAKADAQIDAVNTLRNATNGTVIAEALSVYISSITNTNVSTGDNGTLTVAQIDNYLGNITDGNIFINKTDLILMAQSPSPQTADRKIGALFRQNVGGEYITPTNQMPILQAEFTAAAVVRNVSWNLISSLNMLVIGTPSPFQNIDRSSNKTLASSIVVATLTGTNVNPNQMVIDLFFRVLEQYKPKVDAEYGCYFMDTKTNRWNSSGCTEPQYNANWNRYECKCNHLTSFALIWLPKQNSNDGSKPTLNAQDIASLVFQSISIACFLAVLVHALVSRWRDPLLKFTTYDILPMLSTLSTTILFIFYIALGMTTFTRTKDASQTECFDDASVLMFFTYFLLIFMFGVKASIAYFNYLRFVVLFPEPSLRRLTILLTVSFAIAIVFVSFAAGFNSNPSLRITQLHAGKLCWFTQEVVYYFLTIPVCIFLLLSLVSFVLVTRRIIIHVRQATSSNQMYERLKRCVIVLLSSSVAQGLAWLLGPFLSIANPNAGQVLGWFFVILNGLEGLWSILLYIIIRRKRMHEPQRVKYMKDHTEVPKAELIRKSKLEETATVGLDLTNTYMPYMERNTRDEKPSLFNDLRDEQMISLPADVEIYAPYS